MSYAAIVARQWYFASVKERETMVCFLALQVIRLDLKNRHYLLVDLWKLRLDAQFASKSATNLREECDLNRSP